ncbi:MAG: glutathione S-transferase N-terminal domain-containing protein [Lautropia sp.]|nr:glutathione S-transferase N-terminal domain-containing protein [Lautropia sp.]
MKLWYSTTSPYARKVRAVIAHHRLDGLIELNQVSSAPNQESPHNQDVPLGRIPVLQRDNGNWLFNSQVISEYLDSMGNGSSLYPRDDTRWDALNLNALAAGLLENTIPLVAEKMTRPESEWWSLRHEKAAQRNASTIAFLAKYVHKFGTELNIGTLFAACALDYVLFRDRFINLRQALIDHALHEWVVDMNGRYPCLASTQYVETNGNGDG